MTCLELPVEWLVMVRGGDACHASVAACNGGPPLSTSASTSGLSRPVLPRRLWRVVGWVVFLSDVIGRVESVMWGRCYPDDDDDDFYLFMQKQKIRSQSPYIPL